MLRQRGSPPGQDPRGSGIRCHLLRTTWLLWEGVREGEGRGEMTGQVRARGAGTGLLGGSGGVSLYLFSALGPCCRYQLDIW